MRRRDGGIDRLQLQRADATLRPGEIKINVLQMRKMRKVIDAPKPKPVGQGSGQIDSQTVQREGAEAGAGATSLDFKMQTAENIEDGSFRFAVPHRRHRRVQDERRRPKGLLAWRADCWQINCCSQFQVWTCHSCPSGCTQLMALASE